MNRYLVVGFIMILPLYGIRKATEELVQGFTPTKKTDRHVKKHKPKIITDFENNLVLVVPGNQLIAREEIH